MSSALEHDRKMNVSLTNPEAGHYFKGRHYE
jgi:hypothetical protein